MQHLRTYVTYALALAVSLLIVAPIHANEAASTSNGLTAAGGPLAIHGFDPVSYFSGVPRRGVAEFSELWNGAVYRFASKDNQKRFSSNPEKYAPQFGGFCAYGASVGKKFDGDPEVYEIVNNRLYFNLNPKIKATWVKDIPGNIKKAENKWSSIKDKPAASL